MSPEREEIITEFGVLGTLRPDMSSSAQYRHTTVVIVHVEFTSAVLRPMTLNLHEVYSHSLAVHNDMDFLLYFVIL